jgi:RNA recognition motif-containing protein
MDANYKRAAALAVARAYSPHSRHLISMPEPPTGSSELISKRLHVSGLTPAISSDDLSRRLASFGSVTALDGLGKRDALGQPRNFAYVTIETTKTQLSRCMQPDPNSIVQS